MKAKDLTFDEMRLYAPWYVKLSWGIAAVLLPIIGSIDKIAW